MLNNSKIINTTTIYCSYYHAIIAREDCWFVTAVLKEQDHICLDRTLDVQQLLYEFFIPRDQEKIFCTIMNHFKQTGSVSYFEKLPNRLENSDELV